MKKYPILLIAWLLPNVAQANLLQALRTALTNQCIPSSGEYCTFAATYDSAGPASNRCRCPCKDQYYDAGIRACLNCDYGTSGYFATSCGATSCRAGYVLGDTSVMANGTCAPGFIGQSASNGRCDPGYIVQQSITRTCEGGINQSSCPAGFVFI